MVRHLIDNTPDRRYAVAKEWCGFASPKHVARFCGDWVGCAYTFINIRELGEANIINPQTITITHD